MSTMSGRGAWRAYRKGDALCRPAMSRFRLMKPADQRRGMCFGALMMRALRWSAAVAACVLAGCGGSGAGSGGDAGAGVAMSGLYAQTEGEHRGQLCLVEREGRAGSFGFITWGRNDANCS